MKKTILVVDDNRSVIDLVRAILERENYEVVAALNVREALTQLAEHSIDLIVSDVMMPEVDGFEFGRRLKENESYADIPILYLTALDSIEDEFEGFMAGGDAYVTKPFKGRELLEKIHKLLAGPRKTTSVLTRRGAHFETARVLILSNDAERSRNVANLLDSVGYETESLEAKPVSLSRLDKRPFHLLVAQVDATLTADGVVRFLASFSLATPLILLHKPEVEVDGSARKRAYACLALPVDAAQLVTTCLGAMRSYREHSKNQ